MTTLGLVKLEQLKKALARLKEGVSEAKDQLERDGTIQRFEFTFELVWKTLKEYALFKGVEVGSPRDAFRVAADLGLIDDPEVWFRFLEARNESAHLYDDGKAKEIFSLVPGFVAETEKLIKKLSNES